MPEAIGGGPVALPASDYGDPDPEWLKVDWRAHLRQVELPGATLNYAEIGEGEPILFVHGLAGCWRNWLENLPHFGRTHRAIALDLPGFGHSPMPSWPIDMPAYGRLIHDFCEKLGVGRVAALVGNSMGGLVATEAAIEEPSRFERLVLVSAAGIGFAAAVASLRARLSLGAFERTMSFLARPHQVWVTRLRGRQLAFGRLVQYPNRLRPEVLRELVEPGLRAPGFPSAIRAIGGYDTRHRLSEIEVPTLVVWGLNDHIVRAEDAIAYHRLIAGSRLELFERTGHLPQLERPARFNALLDEFLGD
ncbi:MAG TPA: alpha/beta fold hydrolase [Solirubrobacterales bacterium]